MASDETSTEEGVPTQPAARKLLPRGGLPSRLRSGEDGSWPSEGGQELLPETHRGMEVMAHSETPGRLYSAKGEINSLPHFVGLRDLVRWKSLFWGHG